jgi:hypothetical protein
MFSLLMISRTRFFKPLNPSFDRLKSFVLPRCDNDDIRKLLERCLDLGDALIKVLKFELHAEEGGQTCGDEGSGCQDMAIIDCRIEPGLSASIVFIGHGNT